jgi:hypothetical protein
MLGGSLFALWPRGLPLPPWLAWPLVLGFAGVNASSVARAALGLAHAVLAPAPSALDLARLERTFNLRAGDGFVEVVGPRLIATVMEAAPKVRLRFAPKPDKDVQALRDGAIDL